MPGTVLGTAHEDECGKALSLNKLTVLLGKRTLASNVFQISFTIPSGIFYTMNSSLLISSTKPSLIIQSILISSSSKFLVHSVCNNNLDNLFLPTSSCMRVNWHIPLCRFKAYNMMTWYMYILQNDSIRLITLRLVN